MFYLQCLMQIKRKVTGSERLLCNKLRYKQLLRSDGTRSKVKCTCCVLQNAFRLFLAVTGLRKNSLVVFCSKYICQVGRNICSVAQWCPFSFVGKGFP